MLGAVGAAHRDAIAAADAEIDVGDGRRQRARREPPPEVFRARPGVEDPLPRGGEGAADFERELRLLRLPGRACHVVSSSGVVRSRYAASRSNWVSQNSR
jgi:hypothetical protein